MAPKFLTYFVSLCFEMRCPKQTTFVRFKTKDLAPHFRLATSLDVKSTK